MIIKLFKISSVLMFASAAPICLYACGNTYDQNKADKHFEFINSLEFSLGGLHTAAGKISFGTAWIYENISDYKYTLLTNYHVYDGFVGADMFIYGFNNYEQRNNEMSLEKGSYKPLINVFGDSFNQFFITRSPDTYMDICAIDIDFGDTVTVAPRLKTKLDNVNGNLLPDKKALKIYDKKYTNFNNQMIYTAGYPWATAAPRVQRESTLFVQWRDTIKYLKPDRSHAISNVTYRTNQDEYWLNPYNDFPMGGGASGSLAINENYEAIGIYWGGMQFVGTGAFQPSFALFYMGAYNDQTKRYDTDFFYNLNNR